MNETNGPQVCERAEELVSFLYGELGEREARSFEQHRRNCPTCESEISAFGSVRNSILAWRDQSLGLTPSNSIAPNAIPTFAPNNSPSALAAIRSFFALSPWWMKGATAVATVVFCLVAGLTVVRLMNENSQSAPIPQISSTGSAPGSEADIERRIQDEVKRRVEAEIAALNSQKDVSPQTIPDRPFEQRRMANENSRTVHDRGLIPASQKMRKPLTRAEREQLAADLRLISDEDEDSLQLLGDRINQ
jgi:hypothetical protein